MRPIFIGLCWGAVLLMLALGNRFGLIADSTSTTLFAVLPILAVIAIGKGRSCPPTRT